jgi:hypothetical protein
MPLLDAWSMDPAVADVIAVALALLFARAAYDKFTDLPHFRELLAAYEILPATLISLADPLVPLLETLAAVALLTGCFEARVKPAAGVAAAMIVGVYAAGIGINLLRGRKHLDCGCTPAGERRAIGAWMVARNSLLASLALLTALPGGARPLGLIDAPILIGGVIACAALYSAHDLLWGKVAPVTAMLRGSR